MLRVEVIVHNTKAYRWGRSLPCFGEIVTRLRGILERFLNAVGCLDCCFVADDTLEKLPLPAQVGQTKVGGIDFNQPRMRRVAEAVLALSTSPTGFTASDLAQKVRTMSGERKPTMGRGAPPMTSRNCGPKVCFARSETLAVTSPFRKVYGPSPRCWSSAKSHPTLARCQANASPPPNPLPHADRSPL